jgi:hypothetical protein
VYERVDIRPPVTPLPLTTVRNRPSGEGF